MDIFAWANQKGGVGKTAGTINLGAALAEEGRRVLLVDFDPQGHLSEALGIPETADGRTVRGYLLGEWTGDPHEMVATHRDRLHVLPTNLDMALLERGLYASTNKETKLARMLREFEDDYDACVIDCAPSLGIVTELPLVAARRREGKRGGVIVPVEAEDSSIRALRLLLRQIAVLEREMEMVLDVLGLVPSRFDIRDGEMVTGVLEAFRGLGRPPVIGEIRKRTDIRRAWREKVSVLEHAPKSEAAGWFRDLAKAVYA